MTDATQVSIAFSKIAELADLLGIQSIGNLPGLWVYQVDPSWTIAVNGHDQKINYQGMTIDPYHCLALHAGWPVGYFNPFSGWMAAGAEDLFLQALDQAFIREGNRTK
jgi:hypothetical protein